MTNQFKLGKCMTRGGEEVRIVDVAPDATRNPSTNIVVRREKGEVSTHYPDGRYVDYKEHAYDLLPNNIEVVRVRLYRVVGYAPELVAECNWQYYDANKNFSQCSDTIEIPVRQSE